VIKRVHLDLVIDTDHLDNQLKLMRSLYEEVSWSDTAAIKDIGKLLRSIKDQTLEDSDNHSHE